MKHLSHSVLIELVHVFAPSISKEGVCEGATCIWLQAVLTGKMQEINFYQRLDTLSTQVQNNVDAQFEEEDATFEDDTKLLNSEEKKIKIADYFKRRKAAYLFFAKKIAGESEIRPFAEAVAIQQDSEVIGIPREYISLDAKKIMFPLTASKALDRSSNLYFVQHASEILENKEFQERIYIEKIEHNGHLKLQYILFNIEGMWVKGILNIPEDVLKIKSTPYIKPIILEALSNEGLILNIKSDIVETVNLTMSELVQYLNKIQEVLKKHNQEDNAHFGKRDAFLLSSERCLDKEGLPANHTVGLYFDDLSKQWHFFDVNQLSDKEEYYYSVDSEQLAPIIFQSFSFDDNKHENFSFSIRYLSTYSNKKHAQLVSDLQIDSKPKAALMSAIEGGNTEMVQTLLNANLLNLAAVEQALKFALENDASDTVVSAFFAGDYKFEKLVNEELRYAASTDNQNIIRSLVAIPGIDVNIKGRDGYTPLMIAAQYGHKSAVQALLTADPEPSIYAVINALKLARLKQQGGIIRGDHAKVIKVLKRTLTARKLILAAYNGDDTTIDALMSVPNIDVNVVDAIGMTPLMFAAQNGHINVVHSLLNANATIDMVNKDGWNALMFAAEENELEIVNALLAANPKSDTVSKALELVKHQDSSIAEVLREKLAPTHKRKRKP